MSYWFVHQPGKDVPGPEIPRVHDKRLCLLGMRLLGLPSGATLEEERAFGWPRTYHGVVCRCVVCGEVIPPNEERR